MAKKKYHRSGKERDLCHHCHEYAVEHVTVHDFNYESGDKREGVLQVFGESSFHHCFHCDASAPPESLVDQWRKLMETRGHPH
jgi:hypothetical protein